MSDSEDDLLAVAAILCVLKKDYMVSNNSSEKDNFLEYITALSDDDSNDDDSLVDTGLETDINNADQKMSQRIYRPPLSQVDYALDPIPRTFSKKILLESNLISEEHFDEILSYVKKDIAKKETMMRAPIPEDERLATVLLYLLGGHQSYTIAKMTKVSKSLVRRMIPPVCDAVYRNLKDCYIKFPQNYDEWKVIAEQFEADKQFPLCVGALDCRHISVFVPKGDGDFYKNEMGYNSIIMLALCDASYKFMFLDVGYNGSATDDEALSQSPLQKVIFNLNDELPDSKEIGCYSRLLPYVFVGDEAFPLEKHLMKPFVGDSNSSMDSKTFNGRLNFARSSIDTACGMMWNRFKVLQLRMRLSPEKTSQVVRACCVLHNYFITKLGENYIDTIDMNTLSPANDTQKINQTASECAMVIRNEFAEHFCYDGV